MTDAEGVLWRALRDRQLLGHKFRRQYSVGPFIVDFVCVEKKLVIEVDGGQHTEQVEADQERSEFIEERGFRVLRFWNHEVMKERDNVLNAILLALGEDQE